VAFSGSATPADVPAHAGIFDRFSGRSKEPQTEKRRTQSYANLSPAIIDRFGRVHGTKRQTHRGASLRLGSRGAYLEYLMSVERTTRGSTYSTNSVYGKRGDVANALPSAQREGTRRSSTSVARRPDPQVHHDGIIQDQPNPRSNTAERQQIEAHFQGQQSAMPSAANIPCPAGLRKI
jgi:hypothetical protein